VHQIAESRGLDAEEIMKKIFVCKILDMGLSRLEVWVCCLFYRCLELPRIDDYRLFRTLYLLSSV
jgi:hypothetical protein